MTRRQHTPALRHMPVLAQPVADGRMQPRSVPPCAVLEAALTKQPHATPNPQVTHAR